MKYSDEFIERIKESLDFMNFSFNNKLTKKEILCRYKKLSKIYHPDTATDETYKDGNMFLKLTNIKSFMIENINSINECIELYLSKNQIVAVDKNSTKDSIMKIQLNTNKGQFIFSIIGYILFIFIFVATLGFGIMNLSNIGTAPTVFILAIFNILLACFSIYYFIKENDFKLYSIIIILMAVISITCAILAGVGAYSNSNKKEISRFIFLITSSGIYLIISILNCFILLRKE